MKLENNAVILYELAQNNEMEKNISLYSLGNPLGASRVLHRVDHITTFIVNAALV